MKITYRILVFVLAVLLFTACGPKSTPMPVSQGDNPYAPQPGDSNMQRDTLTIDSSSLKLAESQPKQVTLNFAYFPPTPCHKLRVEVAAPDSQNKINVNAYTVMEKDKACVLMALATPLQASLTLGSFPNGHYSVWLNGSLVSEFDS